jgi:hypothetical protein
LYDVAFAAGVAIEVQLLTPSGERSRMKFASPPLVEPTPSLSKIPPPEKLQS